MKWRKWAGESKCSTWKQKATDFQPEAKHCFIIGLAEIRGDSGIQQQSWEDNNGLSFSRRWGQEEHAPRPVNVDTEAWSWVSKHVCSEWVSPCHYAHLGGGRVFRLWGSAFVKHQETFLFYCKRHNLNKTELNRTVLGRLAISSKKHMVVPLKQ